MKRAIRDEDRRVHFNALTEADQVAAVRRMAVSGQHPTTIASATGWSLEAVARVLREPPR